MYYESTDGSTKNQNKTPDEKIPIGVVHQTHFYHCTKRSKVKIKAIAINFFARDLLFSTILFSQTEQLTSPCLLHTYRLWNTCVTLIHLYIEIGKTHEMMEKNPNQKTFVPEFDRHDEKKVYLFS